MVNRATESYIQNGVQAALVETDEGGQRAAWEVYCTWCEGFDSDLTEAQRDAQFQAHLSNCARHGIRYDDDRQ